MHHAVSGKPSAFRMVADNPLFCWHLAQVNILDMVLHVRDALEGARSLLVWKPLVSDANDTLGLLADDGKVIRRLGGLRSGRFLFEQTCGGWNGPRLASASLELLSGGERDHEVDGRDLSSAPAVQHRRPRPGSSHPCPRSW
jgi:hypothetical protein